MAVILTSLVLISGIAILFRYYARYKLNYWKRRGVESLPTDLIFGNFKNAALFKTAPGWHLGELHNAAITNSPMLGFYIFHKPCILLRDLKLIKQIMVRDFENFSDRHFAGSQQKDSIGMKNLFGLKNPAWKYVRSKITPTLTKVSQFYHGIKRMIALVAVFFTPEIVELFGTRVLFNSNFIEKVFWKSMETREKTGIKRGDFIDSLIKLKNEPQNPDYKFEGENLFYQSGTFFSGFESSSTTSSFTLMELAKHSDFQQKAREDINASIEKHGLTYEAFNDMKYLDQCIAEGIRLHPPVSTIDRYTRNDYQIPGTDIVLEKGTAVYISLYGLQQDPRFFENSLDFNPERFNSETNVSDAYIPFGVGPRMCIGMKVGQLHAKVVITMILRRYEVIQLSKDEITLDNRSTFTAAADGINLQFKEIKS
ncbi:cytochrome P450 6k1-like isoform X2 [Leptopilina boulardi]|uniref:cytochrome P450 6k1-like isoform X2 n=1 Tax=Leptopilina boulardi TaxID=63433 RepID=UPI0021F6613E|nr:cytochrome P450 6k1-like isoform X2 [Leptopilina boulardi]